MTPGQSPRRTLETRDWPDDAEWHRRRLETEQAYACFLLFLDVPARERTIVRAFEQAGGPQGEGPSANLKAWQRWAKLHKWKQRALAYDHWVRDRDAIEAEAALREEERRWAELRRQERETELDVGRALIEKAKAMLQFPLAEVERVTETYADGRARSVQIFKPGRWRFGDVARMVDIGSKLVRLATEMETERTRVDMNLIWEEAERLASEHGLERDDILAMADKIVEERWGRVGGGPGRFSPPTADDDDDE